MQFETPLARGRLIKRYKRFLADVALDTGDTVTATCPNTGSMKGLTEPGSTVWLSTSDSPTRKYRHTWEMVEHDLGKGATIVGINTNHPNRIVSEAIAAGKMAPAKGYANLRREVKYGNENSRIDIFLEDPKKGQCYVEIKNVHLMRRPGLAEFPDSVTERGAKHLRELSEMVRQGHRALMVFLIQRGDATRIDLARDIDPKYGEAFDAAVAAGVEALAYRCQLTPSSIEFDKKVRVVPG
ncbi:MAG: DNA/RNA nuclease SfsA [Hyphomicrobiaceae bacterium]